MIVMEDDVQVYNSLFTLLADSNYDKDDQVNLLDIKDNLKDYSHNRLKSLVSVLIDNVNELTKEK